jgi:glucan phosphoethanolaminetransferase (alkaline phosphatase superfamily)
MKYFFKNAARLWLFAAAATLFVGAAYTSADFFTAPAAGVKDAAVLFFQWAVVALAVFPVIFLLSLNKFVFAAVFPLICFLSGILTYFRYTTGTTFTTMILNVALDHDMTNSAQLISSPLIAVAAGSLVAGIVFAVVRFKQIGKINFLILHLVAGLFILIVILKIPNIRRPAAERIPLNIFFVTERYFSEKRAVQIIRPPLPSPVSCGDDKPITVFVIGESLRPDHLGFNGYEKNTTPFLSQEDVISFPNIYSEATFTNASIPVIMTRADSIDSPVAETERSFIDLFKQCGYFSAWLANQEQRNSYYYFMKECDTLIYGNINKSTYVFDLWTDELLLPSFDSLIENRQDNMLLVLHTIGSHWYFNAHYPEEEFRKFVPVTKSRIVSANTREEMINAYDNTVLYTDYFIYSLINRLRDKNAVLIYLSDHGEALGENGKWLHAIDAPEVHSTACFFWLSPQYKALHAEKYDALQANRNRHYSTNFLFHTILESAGIESDVVEKQKSLFSR